MASILEMLQNRLPDEAVMFAASLATFIEEAQAEAGFEGIGETELGTLQKGLVADIAGKALILPAMSKYKKSLESAEGDGSGSATYVDKLKFLREMDYRLNSAILTKQEKLETASDCGVPLIVVG